MSHLLPFEKPLQPLYLRLEELIEKSKNESLYDKEIEMLKKDINIRLENIYKNLEPFDIVSIARHPERPKTEEYIENFFDEFTELHGDRKFKDDLAIISGIGKINGEVVGLIGHRKGKNVKENLKYNFGMSHAEGYRKAIRVMKLIAEKFKAPILTLLDTPGAMPTIEAEERGIAEAIAVNLEEMFKLKIPIISINIGEGGSGGALGIGIADKILMLEYSIYSVISPEGCASIVYRDSSKAREAANALKLTAKELLKLNLIDEIIEEGYGGAHRKKLEVIERTKETFLKNLDKLKKVPLDELLEKRKSKWLNF